MQSKTIGNLWTGFGSAGPRSFYQLGADGAFFDFSTPATLFTDAAGTTPLTAPGQTIGLACDKSRARSPVTAYAGIQASAGLRPTYGRGPKSRRNLLTETEFRNGVTTDASTRGGLVSASTLAGYAAAVAYGHDGVADTFAYKSRAVTAGVTYTLSAIVEMTDGLGPPAFSVADATNDFLLVMEGTFQPAANHVVSALGGGLYRVSATRVAAASAASNFGVVKMATYSSRTFKVTGYQLEVGALSAYQRVTTSFDITEPGQPAFGYARLDGADDKLTVTLPSAITGDLMIFGRKGSWIETGVTLPSGAFDLGPTGTVLTPGVLSALGDLVGAVIIGRTTTAAERALALRYFAARGAANWLVAGAEAEPNGAFASGTGWTVLAGWAISGGVANATATSASLTSTTPLTAGQLYLVTFDWVHTSGTLAVRAGVGAQATFTTSGAKRVILQTTSVAGVEFYGGAVTGALDNVSVKPLTVAA